MTEPSLIHHTFTLERRFPVTAADVFAAWSDPHAKRRWFTGDNGEHVLDFRVGGVEVVKNVGDNGRVLLFESRYLDIIDDTRIVYVSTLTADDELATTSITSVELQPETGATVLVLTESDVFLDGQEQPSWREHGTGDWLDALGNDLQRANR